MKRAKKLLAVMLSLTVMGISGIAPTSANADSAAAEAAVSVTDSDSLYVVAGTYNNTYTQLRNIYTTASGTVDARKVVMADTSAKYSYGDIISFPDEPTLTKVQSYPNDPVYSHAYYYELGADAKGSVVGSCAELLPQKELTVTRVTYDGSGHWSVRLKDDGGAEYYYGLNYVGSQLGFDVTNMEVGDVYTFAMFGDTPALPLAAAEAPTVKPAPTLVGDANLDVRVTVADSVAILQHIANRDKYGLSPQGLANADVDGEGGVTANDALILKQQDAGLIPRQEYTTRVDYGNMLSNNLIKDSSVYNMTGAGIEAVITDTDGLRAFFSEICSDEAVEAYAAEFGEDFFSQNVLLVDAIAQRAGMEPRLVINSVDIGDTVTVSAEWENKGAYETIMSLCIGMVTMPKQSYTGQPAEWKIVERPACSGDPAVREPLYAAKVHYNMGQSGYRDDIDIWAKIRGGYAGVITSTDELRAYLSEICTDEQTELYCKKYDDEFFAGAVLFINTISQSMGAEPRLSIGEVDFTDEGITVCAEWEPIEVGESVMSVCVGLVYVAKEFYTGQPVTWTCNK
ncbi:MAG: dockerin type I repeat-containing protein [Ruminococcus sp.]|nr:dockerin type I repeat-containing protein [Ruminococcus sp.]